MPDDTVKQAVELLSFPCQDMAFFSTFLLFKARSYRARSVDSVTPFPFAKSCISVAKFAYLLAESI